MNETAALTIHEQLPSSTTVLRSSVWAGTVALSVGDMKGSNTILLSRDQALALGAWITEFARSQ